MLKYLFVFLAGILICQNVEAQNRDTLLYYRSKEGKIVSKKDSAYFITKVSPPDTTSGEVLYNVSIYNLEGKEVSSGTSVTNNIKYLEFIGAIVSYYPDGSKKGVFHASKGIMYDLTDYYNNGKLYYLKKYVAGEERFIECRDSTGKIMTENGNGKWITFDKDIKNVMGGGEVKDSLQNGVWHGTEDGLCTYTINYTNGKAGAGTGYDKAGNAYPFINYSIQASFKGGNVAFSKFISDNIVYPKEDKRNNIQGRVIVKFTVEKDGQISNIKVLKAPDELLGVEAVRVLQSSPLWNPSLMYGLPVQAYFAVPISFSLRGGR